ncbi:hypothetical protein Tco_1276680 [Tanacetum coccineum]
MIVCERLNTTKEKELILLMVKAADLEISMHGDYYEMLAHLGKEENMEQAAREARLSKPKLIKVVHEEATKAGVDPKALSSKKGS